MHAYFNNLVQHLLTQSWHIAVLTIGVAIAARALKNKSAHIRYCLWLIVLAKCLLPPLYAVRLDILPSTGPVDEFRAPAPRQAMARQPILAGDQPALTAPVARAVQAQQQGDTELVGNRTSTAPSARWTAADTKQLVAIVWLTGACLYLLMNLLRAIRGSLWLARERKLPDDEAQKDIENLCAPYRRTLPSVYLIDNIPQPFVWGLLRGSIYLPSDFLELRNSDHRRNILAHEISHVVRLDAAVNLLQILVQAAFWFHPFIWYANTKIRREREKCCDEMAIARLHARPKDYGSAIVETLASQCSSARPISSLAIVGPAKNVEERIRTMLRPGRKFYTRPTAVAAIASLILACLIVPTAFVLTARAEATIAAKRPQTPTRRMLTAAAQGDLKTVEKSLAEGLDINVAGNQGYTALHYAAEKGHAALAEFLIARGADLEARNKDGRTPLALAAFEGHKGMVEALLAKGADFNTKDRLYKQLLHHAAVNGHSELAAYLIAAGANINAKTNLRYTPLYLATLDGHSKTVELLVAKGADVNAPGQSKVTPLHVAADKGHLEAARLLIKGGADIHALESTDHTPLYKAVMAGHRDVAVLLVEHEAVVPFPTFHFAAFMGDLDKVKRLVEDGHEVDTMIIEGYDPLGFAVLGCSGPVAKYLVAQGADVHARKSTRSHTLLHKVARTGNKDMAELLISLGADVNASASSGKAKNLPLDHAAINGNYGVAAVLLKHGANPNAKGYCSVVPMHRAAQKDHIDIAKLLLEYDADVNTRAGAFDQFTPLHWAGKSPRVAKLLIENGADVNAKDDKGVTPLHRAAGSETYEVVKLLIDGGADVNPKDKWLRTPLHEAVADDNYEAIELLIAAGADLTAKNHQGQTPLEIAKQRSRSQEVIELLQKHGAK